MYIFGPPGWSHDGSTKTVKQMQKELESGAMTASQPIPIEAVVTTKEKTPA